MLCLGEVPLEEGDDNVPSPRPGNLPGDNACSLPYGELFPAVSMLKSELLLECKAREDRLAANTWCPCGLVVLLKLSMRFFELFLPVMLFVGLVPPSMLSLEGMLSERDLCREGVCGCEGAGLFAPSILLLALPILLLLLGYCDPAL